MVGNMSPATSKVALTVNEFCSTCSIGRTSFYELVKAGHIRVIKMGRRTLVPATEVAELLEALSALSAH